MATNSTNATGTTHGADATNAADAAGRTRLYGDTGFTLVEVLIAMALLAVLATGIATLTISATRAVARARAETAAVTIARARLEQLRGLAWGFGSAQAPRPVSDFSTDLGAAVPQAGGPGLSTTSTTVLDSDVAGHVDYVDMNGRWMGVVMSGGARFVRRWSVQPVASFPDTLLLQVRVRDLRGVVNDVDLFTVRTRTAA
jgi:prepilin-type N-terminal cleavage/methylation domain-containing protein